MREHGGSLFKTDAITLKSYSFNENDKIVTLFSEELGMVNAVAKGARKIKSHLLSSTLPFSEGNYLLYKGRSLYTISQFEFKKAFKNIADNISNLICAEYMAELTLKTGGEYYDKRLYRLLKEGLTYLEKGYCNSQLLGWAFAIHIMDMNGVMPNLEYCTQCGRAITGKTWFNTEAGGVLCDTCHNSYANSFVVDKATLSVCGYIQKHRFEALNRVSFNMKTGKEINNIVKSCLSYYISQDIKTVDLLDIHVLSKEWAMREKSKLP